MPFFSLTDIKIKEPENSVRQGSFLPSPYISNVLRYPIDLGSLDKGHYMVIHINEQVNTKFKGTGVAGDLPTILDNQKRNGTGTALSNLGPDIKPFLQDSGELLESTIYGIQSSDLAKKTYAAFTGSEITAAINVPEDVAKAADATAKATGKIGAGAVSVLKPYIDQLASGSGLRTIRRTTDTIALYMPDTLSFTQNQSYSSMEFGNSPLALLAAAAAGYSKVTEMKEGDRLKGVISNLTPFIASRALQKFGGNAGAAVFAAASGTVINPQLELIYTSPSFREFRFDFMLYPRSSKEALEIHKILNRLKFHQAPEIYSQGNGALGSFFLVPPSEFDIKFYYNGRINPNIPPISTCVLTSIDTDYAPNGWAAYEVPSNKGVPALGKTGTPVGIRLSLNFQETEILTKQTYDNSGKLSVTDFSADETSSIESRGSFGDLR